MYTKPLGDIIRNHQLKYHFYADDSQIYTEFDPNSDFQSTVSLLDTCIQDVRTWMGLNCLKFNDSKTEVVLFGSGRGLLNARTLEVRVGNVSISPAVCARNLGVMYDQNLVMDKHVKSVCRVCYMQLHRIGRIKKYLSTDALKSLIHATITSRLDYANGLLYGINKCHLYRLQKVQNHCARIIAKSGRRSHMTPILKSLHWLPIKQRITFKVLLYTFKSLLLQCPTYISNLVERYMPARPLRSAGQDRLVIPDSKKMFGDRRFRMASAVLWNALPSNIKECTTVRQFKIKLKTHLFSCVFN